MHLQQPARSRSTYPKDPGGSVAGVDVAVQSVTKCDTSVIWAPGLSSPRPSIALFSHSGNKIQTIFSLLKNRMD